MPHIVGDGDFEQDRARSRRGRRTRSPIATEYVKEETKSLLRSKGAVGSYVISSGLVFALVYIRMERARRLERIEEKLDVVVDEVADEDD